MKTPTQATPKNQSTTGNAKLLKLVTDTAQQAENPTDKPCLNNTPSGTNQPLKRPCNLSTFIRLAIPAHEAATEAQGISYLLDTTAETFSELQSATFNTECALDEWIEVIGKLISHVGAYSPEEFGAESLQSVGWLISELSACNREIKNAAHILDNASI